jgi:hypothetical protein
MRISNDFQTVHFSGIPSIESIRGNSGSSQGSVQNLQYKLSQALEDAGKHFDQVVTAIRGNNQFGELQKFQNKVADMSQSQGTANNFRLQDYMNDYSRMQSAIPNVLSRESLIDAGLLRNLR